MKKRLQKLGLGEKESKVYLAILELGHANIQAISKKSGVKRTTVYDVLEDLKKKGLISITGKGKRNVYVAEDPRKIGHEIDERKHAFTHLLPELLSLANLLDKKPRIRYFEGLSGLREVYEDTLTYHDQEIVAWIADEGLKTMGQDYFTQEYDPERKEKKIWVRAIAPDNELMRDFKKLDAQSLRQTRIISNRALDLDVEIVLYGKSKIGIIAFNEEMGLIIESTKIYKTLKSIFELCWGDSE
ncbi:hypothetical protein EPO05_04355 [Patescibacteria group bacterium]|nr:MAG: hypothetical protein EPO05_04355 [Patescibacteria group bacterium]